MARLEFRSSLRKLVVFFEASRDKWKNKCQQTKYELKLLKRRFANLESNRDKWQQSFHEAEAQCEQLRVRGEHLQAQYQQAQSRLESHSKKRRRSSASIASTACG